MGHFVLYWLYEILYFLKIEYNIYNYKMTTHQDIMEPIDFSEDITTEIIRRCELLLAENNEYKKLKESGCDFNSIKIYGSRQEPCFKAKDIYLYVDPKGTNKTWFNKQLLQDKHIFKANTRNIKSNGNKTWTKVELTNMLTRKGLMKAFSIFFLLFPKQKYHMAFFYHHLKF